MAKISSYTNVGTPLLTDKLIGTEVGGTPPNVTKNFTIQQLQNLIDVTKYKQVIKKITPAEMLSLDTTDVEILPPAGVDKTYNPIDLLVYVDFNSVVYNFTDAGSGACTIVIKQNTGLAGEQSPFKIIPSTLNTSSKKTDKIYGSMANDTLRLFNDASILIRSFAGTVANQGNSDVYIKLTYQDINLSTTF